MEKIKMRERAFKKVRKDQVSMTELLLDYHAEMRVKYTEKNNDGREHIFTKKIGPSFGGINLPNQKGNHQYVWAELFVNDRFPHISSNHVSVSPYKFSCHQYSILTRIQPDSTRFLAAAVDSRHPKPQCSEETRAKPQAGRIH